MKLQGWILPRSKSESKVVQSATSFKNSIAETTLPVADRLLDNPIPLHASNRMLSTDTDGAVPSISAFFDITQLTATRLLFRLQNRHIFDFKPLESTILC